MKLYFDGSNHTYGYMLGDTHVTEPIPLELPHTNNVGEYLALIRGLEKALELGVKDLEIVGDSQLVVYQVLGRYKVRKSHLKPLLEQARQLLSHFTYTIRWVPRAENLADNVSRFSSK